MNGTFARYHPYCEKLEIAMKESKMKADIGQISDKFNKIALSDI